jgi:hypothetical protein
MINMVTSIVEARAPPWGIDIHDQQPVSAGEQVAD